MRIPTLWKWQPGLKANLIVMALVSALLITALTVGIVILGISAKSCDKSIPDTPLVSALKIYPPSKPTFVNKKENKGKTDAVCVTPECVHTASKILKNMNPEVEPCDDFYKFACGGFVESTQVPDDKVYTDNFDIVRDIVKKQLRATIEEPSRHNEPKPLKFAKTLYRTCLNTSAIEKVGLKPVEDIIEKLGGWPLNEGENWKEDDFDWIKTAYRLRELGFPSNYFIGFSVDVEWKNSMKRIISLDQSPFENLPREFLIQGFENNVVKFYFKYMTDIASFFGADKQLIDRELKETLEFQIKLAKISLSDVERRNFTVLDNHMSISELTNRYPSIKWEEYINNLLPSNVRIRADEIVRVVVPSYISDLEELLKNTPKRVQANFIIWRVVASSVTLLSEKIRNREFEYTSVLYGKSERSPRWKECLDLVSGFMAISTGALYIREYVKEGAKKIAAEMVDDFKKEFTRILEQAEWMDEETRNKALEKAASMSSHIAYANELLDDKKLEEFYTNLELGPDNFFENSLNVTRFLIDSSFKDLKKPVNRSDWIADGSPAVVNTFYKFTTNNIQVPAGILQGIFFNEDRPRYMNYGAIGFLIGHEITHGFDDQGSQFDKDGNLFDWWAPETKNKYLKKADCIIKQYGNYTVEAAGLNVNGVLTQGENIADNGGIKVAYSAYKQWVKRNRPEQRLPGLKDFTPEQMFWISAANIWCVKFRPESALYELTTDVHSPHRFRVIGSLSNMPEFAEDFKCPAGSAMNPVQKCSVW